MTRYLIKLENIECVKTASIMLDGISVITGNNNTGKTATLMAALTALDVLSNTPSIYHCKSDWLKDVDTEDKSACLDFFMHERMSYRDFVDSVDMERGKFTIMDMDGCTVLLDTSKRYIADEIEYTPVNMYDMSSIASYGTHCLDTCYGGHIEPYAESLIDHIETVLRTKFNNDNLVTYMRDNGYECDEVMLSSPIYLFMCIVAGLRHNVFVKDTIMFLDSVSATLHPKMQVELANAIVKIHKFTGCRFMFTTVSEVFIRALSALALHYGINEKVLYHVSSECPDGGGDIYNVTCLGKDVDKCIESVSVDSAMKIVSEYTNGIV